MSDPSGDAYSPFGPSLTAVLPVTSASISHLEYHLRSLLGTSDTLSDVVVLSPRSLHAQIRQALRLILSEEEAHEVELSISQWPEGLGLGSALIQAARRVSTEWVLLADEEGLEHFDNRTRDILLLNPPPSDPLPMGPRGVDFRSACLEPSFTPKTAAYLVPPLALPVSLLPPARNIKPTDDPWVTLGDSISRSTSRLSGGLAIGSSNGSLAWCERYVVGNGTSLRPPTGDHGLQEPMHSTQENGTTPLTASGVFLFAAYAREARFLVHLACELVRQGHEITFLVLQHDGFVGQDLESQLRVCQAAVYLFHSHSSADLGHLQHELVEHIPHNMDVVVSTLEDEFFFQLSGRFSQNNVRGRTSVVRIPEEDLPYCDWMSAVDLEGWKNWHVPQIELSVITDHRPYSLQRLLSSLANARYFGDQVDLRINIEQTADTGTLQLVNDHRWEHGSVFYHHRVAHAGLMAAVVESWYPKGNDTYGLLLEDDVEVSPLFYAWAKLSLLRYRYGQAESRSPNLYGISLYQQKNIELHPDGRHLFNARSTFEAAGLVYPNTPYLSQIPCSWGALYFPEHWREFHEYLVTRLNASVWPLDEVVVPGVRSNRWTRSWKKYFIELVYLRGYVMLYPNYADYMSLSTNHLEVGSHVRDIPIETYLRKKKLFNLPLMPLPPATLPRDLAIMPSTGLLELPEARLPDWHALPVLDLLGTISNETMITLRGGERRTELTGCDVFTARKNDVGELLCID
ncbi:hypothetical protein DICSQDRAFT_101090 [Dichomitus squalens LYAD-421 SS1]|uniref:Uncharacterized protein n=1 Tax=Dichomitus squalens TaxID=114155 RepID=A0A4Q9MVX8_9APHY|nr:uncharacterized protein DICSQDRAFT_101090 [Dichomitus squalens LYAD-421 SS1]EJF64269.1 hypothetical protein DICSQDRAFT_101090 [Dichomitus squalens LYAD-421 SS1]TBU30631.1 hypothetical protein BD311DRAFT_658440 [Dichomitus squalens]